MHAHVHRAVHNEMPCTFYVCVASVLCPCMVSLLVSFFLDAACLPASSQAVAKSLNEKLFLFFPFRPAPHLPTASLPVLFILFQPSARKLTHTHTLPSLCLPPTHTAAG